jgi:pyruvate kinase
MRKTKIVCTIGPASESREMIASLIDAGMNVARLNFSHGDYEEHAKRIKLIREVSARKRKYVGIMLDTKGPEIRLGNFKDGSAYFAKGSTVKITKEEVLGDQEKFHIVSPSLFVDAKVGDYLLIDDGKMRLTIIDKEDGDLICRVENNGILKSRKGVNVPSVKLSIPFLSKRDVQDLEFGVKNGVDIIAASFVRKAEDILELRKVLAELGQYDTEIVAKIENQEAFENIDSILEVTDGIMVARGDLGVDISLQLVPIYQKKLIARANEIGRPVITATHMLESMMYNPRPTRAEASDVANAILDGSDAIMLSGETAAGEYPIEAVTTMATIAEATEHIVSHRDLLNKAIASSMGTKNDAIGIAVSETALTLKNVSAVFAFTETGGTAKRICKFRPAAPIVAITNSVKTARKLSYYWGVTSIIAKDVDDVTKYDEIANYAAKQLGIKAGSTVIITSGWKMQHGLTNTMRIVEVEY